MARGVVSFPFVLELGTGCHELLNGGLTCSWRKEFVDVMLGWGAEFLFGFYQKGGWWPFCIS